MKEKKIFLKKDKERSILQNRHPWIFSGAIDRVPENFSNGEIAHVYSSQGQFLAVGYFHLDNSLCGRILSFEKEPVLDILKKQIEQAWRFRCALLDFTKTNCYRLINAEEDGLPGLIVDVYDQVLVMQIHTYGMERLKDKLVDLLVDCLRPKSVYEKSNSSARLQEGLDAKEGWVWGEQIEEVVVRENGIQFVVSITEGQKTGLFLDQREMRKKVGELSANRRVLNCFSYTGGFSLHALKGGAKAVTSVDICAKASSLNERNTLLNGFSLDRHAIVQEDVFDFLKSHSLVDYNLILLDPPAFAKKRQDIPAASKGYKQLNQMVFELCAPNTLILTCSCSYFIDRDLFQHIIFQAASAAKRQVKILSRHVHAFDHPISLYHPEGDYLKSLFLMVE
jgi:23S rRNA (cytosine1962-C5)-methyltransferase